MLTDSFGRRMTMLYFSTFTIVGIILLAAARDIAMFTVARVILGFGTHVNGIVAGVLGVLEHSTTCTSEAVDNTAYEDIQETDHKRRSAEQRRRYPRHELMADQYLGVAPPQSSAACLLPPLHVAHPLYPRIAVVLL